MSEHRKYLLLAALLGLILLPVLLSLCLQLGQQVLKNLREERFSQNSLQTIQVPESAVVWEEKGRELRIDGRYFDVASWQSRDGILYLTGHFDDAETKLWEMLGHSAGHQKENKFFSIMLLLQCLQPMLLIRFLFRAFPAKIFWVFSPIPVLLFGFLLPPYCPPRAA